MREHLSPQLVTRFHEQALEPNDGRSIYDHIKKCNPCRRLIVDERVEATALRTLMDDLLPDVADESYHLDFELIEGYVDNNLSALDRSTAEMHLEMCAGCAAQVKDLETSLRTMLTHTFKGRPHEYASLLTNGLHNLRLVVGPPQIALATGIILLASATVVIWRLKSQELPTPNQPIVAQESTPRPSESSSPTAISSPSPAKNGGIPNVKGERDQFVNRGKNVEKNDMLIALVDGSRKISLDRSGTMSGLVDLPTETQQQVKTVLLAQTITKPEVIADLRSDQPVSRGSSGEQTIRPVVPAAVISDDRPLFKWTPVKDAISYRVVVGDPNFQPVARSDQLPANTTEWEPPTPLPRGIVYTWVVKATKREQESSSVSSPPVKFKVLETERLAELASLKKGSPSHLALGVFYARAGMIAEAEQEFQILLRANPNSRLAKKLLKDVTAWQ